MSFVIMSTSVYSLNSAVEHTGVKIMYEGGINGSDNTICLIDGGLYYQHQNLGGCVGGSCRVLATYNAFNDSSSIDIDYHGTWTAGVIISNHSKYTGIAPGARLVFVESKGPDNWHDALEWCVNHKDDYNISIISMSQSRHANQSYTNCLCKNISCDSTPFKYDYYNLTSLIQSAVNNKITLLFSAGNQYQGGSSVWPDGTPVTESANYPACLPNVIAVGSVNDEDVISDFSNRKEFVEIMAPGEDIITTHTDGGFSYMTESKIKRFLCNFELASCGVSGTSFSTPYLAGVVALMRDYDSGLSSPSYIKILLNQSGKKIYDPLSNKNYSRVDLNELFGLLSWPTFHHDNRRTGFTLLKGDIESASQKTYGLALSGGITSTALARPSIANVNNNDNEDQNVIIGFSKTGVTDGFISNVEYSKKWWQLGKKWTEVWNTNIGYSVTAPPSLGNTYGDKELEIVVGLKNGSLIVLDLKFRGEGL